MLSIALVLPLVLGGCSQHSPYKPDPSMVARSATEEQERRLDAHRLVGPVWRWQRFGDAKSTPTVPDTESFSLRFVGEGLVEVQADCDRIQGAYAAYRGSLQLAFGPMTLSACNQGSLGELFLQRLNDAAGYFFQGERLFVDLAADGGTLEFVVGG